MSLKNHIMLGASYLRQRQYPNALACLQQAHLANPGNTTVMRMMADCYLKLNDFSNGIGKIQEVLAIDTADHRLYFKLAHIQKQLGNFDSAIANFKKAIALKPRELQYITGYADLFEKTNQYEKALEVIDQGLSQFPDNVPLQILAAKSERLLGRTGECLVRLERLGPREASLPSAWQALYHFELGHAYDRCGQVDKAFQHFSEANKTIRSLPPYQRVDKAHSLNLIDSLQRLDYGKVNAIIEAGKSSPPAVQPVFFVGFPRSGTTLLQKVLDSHQGIQVIEENNPLGRVTSLIEGDPQKYLESGFLLDENNIDRLRQMYFDEAGKHISLGGDSLIVDKLPMNIVQIHIIKILFPSAKVLLGLRHPCDCVLSCFMQNFAVNPAMASMFEFGSIINYYDKTMRLWNTFRSRIDFQSYPVRYEDLVGNMEGEVRKLLKFLDLEWDGEVLNYRQNAFNRGLISTPSYSQVVKPIYTEARYRWLRYAKYFEPYLDRLKPHCDEFGYSLQTRG